MTPKDLETGDNSIWPNQLYTLALAHRFSITSFIFQ